MENCVCSATQWHNKFRRNTVKITKPITLPPFSTTVVKGHTKLNGHGMRHNMIAEPSEYNQLPPSVHCIPTYCNLAGQYGIHNSDPKRTGPTRTKWEG